MRGGRAAVRFRFRAEARARRWAWLAVATVVGLSAGVVLALVAGARRSDSAVERFVSSGNAHAVEVVSGVPGTFDFAALDLDEVAALPGVVDSAPAPALAAAGRTEDGRLLDSGSVNYLADASGRIGSELSRFQFVAGRPADPEDPREVVAIFRAAEIFGLDVGDVVRTNFLDGEELGRLFAPAGEAATFDELADEGPLEELRVVGIAVQAGALAPPSNDDTTSLWLTPAALEAFGESAIVDSVFVQLGGDDDAEADYLRRIEELGGGQHVLYASVREDARDADRGVTPVVRALYLAAALLTVVSLLVTGQLLARQAAVESGDDGALRAIGWTRRELLRLRVAKAALIGVGAAVLAGLVAVALSPLFPLGLAGLVEPDPGVDVDATVLVTGVLAVVVGTTGLAALIGWSRLRWSDEASVERPSRLVGALTSSGASPPVVAGASLALQRPGPGAPSPLWAAGTTVVLGLVTVVAVLGFMASLGHLTRTPPLYGWNWDVELGQEFAPELEPADVRWLRDDPAVVAMALGATVTLEVEGQRAAAYAVDDVLGTVEPSLLDGRRAEDLDEVVVVPAYGAIGEHLAVSYGGERTELEVVGHAALPRAEVMMTFEALRRLAPDAARQVALVELRDGTIEGFVDRVKGEPLGLTDQDVAVPDLPDDLVNFGRVDAAPGVVAGAMAVVGFATLVHSLVTTIRRRRRDLAVLRTLGFTRRQVRTAVGWQAAALTLVAVALALPIGVALGRWSWLLFASELQVVGRPVVPVLGLLLAVLATGVLTSAVAVATGRWSTGHPPSSILRSE